jgi:hypothetical protein
VGTKSGFIFPEHRWLLSEPENWYQRRVLTWAEMLDEEWTCDLGSGVRVGATVGGMLTLDFAAFPSALAPSEDAGPNFEAQIAAMRVRVQVANALALSIHSATLELDKLATGGFRVTHEDLMHFHSSLSGFSGGAGLPLVPGEGYLMPRLRTGCCREEVLLRASELLEDVLSSVDPEALNLINLLNHGLIACRGHDFDLAVVTAWSVCERVMGQLLLTYAEAQASAHSLPLNRDRRNNWNRLNAATTTEVLALAGQVPPDLEERVSRIRKVRNAWIHGGDPVSYGMATESVMLAATLLERYQGLAFRVAPSVGVAGLGV